MRHLVDSCPKCGAMLVIDGHENERRHGKDWREQRIPAGEVAMWCPGCEYEPRTCPNCGERLRVDVEYMDDTFGAMWRDLPHEDVSVWCPGCGEAGTYGELVEIYGDPDD